MGNPMLCLPQMFCSGMIVQRDLPIYVFGTAEIGGLLEVEFDGVVTRKEISAGSFEIQLPSHAAGRGLVMKFRFHDEVIRFDDVYCGEVWVAGGQSNMAMQLRETTEYSSEKANLDTPDIRLYTVGRNLYSNPADYPLGYDWVCNPDLPWEGCNAENAMFFSAVGYHFAQCIYRELDVPVGIINCNVGGSSIFNWMPSDVILSSSKFASVYTDFEQKMSVINRDEALEKYIRYLDHLKEELASSRFSEENGGDNYAVFYEELGPYTMNQPCNLYHSMLRRVSKYTARGMIWYQGESEAFSESSGIYAEAMEKLTGHLRELSGYCDYAFHYVQIAPWQNDDIRDWEGICDAQRRFHLSYPNYGMVTIGDCGAGDDIHPPVKMLVGQRLAAAACTLTYGIPQPFCGPVARNAYIENDTVVVEFIYGDGLDGQDLTAEVEYADGSVCSESAYVEQGRLFVNISREAPEAVRYGWCSDYRIGLYNSCRLPASVFRLELAV